jgi:transcriptional regulator with XRE-family HTH domain
MRNTSLVYFSAVQPGRRNIGEHPTVGEGLRKTRLARRMTQARVARASKVSRRHLALAEAGGNITLTVLKKLMGGLQLSEIDLGEVTATATQQGINPAVLRTIVEQAMQGLALLTAAVESLRNYADAANPETAKAATLIKSFTDYVQGLTDKDDLADLERMFQEVVHPEQPALQEARGDASPTRRTRSSRTK